MYHVSAQGVERMINIHYYYVSRRQNVHPIKKGLFFFSSDLTAVKGLNQTEKQSALYGLRTVTTMTSAKTSVSNDPVDAGKAGGRGVNQKPKTKNLHGLPRACMICQGARDTDSCFVSGITVDVGRGPLSRILRPIR